MKELIHTSQAPQAIGPYSQAIRVDKTVYISGQIPLDAKTMNLISDDFAEQTKQVLTNLHLICEAAGGSFDHIVKLTIYLVDLAQFPIVNDLLQASFKKPYPARVTIQVAALPKNAQVEIDAIMALP